MLPLLPVLLGLSVLSGLPRDVIGGCSIKTGIPSPLIVTSFGSKSFVNDKQDIYEREEGENIQLYCGGGFSFSYSDDNYGARSQTTSKVTLECDYNSNFNYNHGNMIWEQIQEIQCLNKVNQLFESKNHLPNCENDMTLVLGFDFGDMGFLKNAALCYDIQGAKLKYFSYTTFPSKNRIVESNQVGQLNDLGLDINVTYSKNLIRSISQNDIDIFMLAEKQVASLFVKNAFLFASLSQGNYEMNGYEDMLGTVWLRVLHSGNWAHWLSAMQEASNAGAHFDVRMGVSGTLEVPMAAVGSCNASRSLVIELSDGSSLPVPAHIWAHVRALQTTGGAEDEFVFIGYNSPFFRSDNSSGLCSSMCDQVSWLKSSLFASLHKFPAYGLVQCCRLEDVAHKLDNFPRGNVDANAMTTTAEPEYKDTLSQLLRQG